MLLHQLLVHALNAAAADARQPANLMSTGGGKQVGGVVWEGGGDNKQAE